MPELRGAFATRLSLDRASAPFCASRLSFLTSHHLQAATWMHPTQRNLIAFGSSPRLADTTAAAGISSGPTPDQGPSVPLKRKNKVRIPMQGHDVTCECEPCSFCLLVFVRFESSNDQVFDDRISNAKAAPKLGGFGSGGSFKGVKLVPAPPPSQESGVNRIFRPIWASPAATERAREEWGFADNAESILRMRGGKVTLERELFIRRESSLFEDST